MSRSVPAYRSLKTLDRAITRCRACERLVEWREEAARVKRASYRDETYWGRAVPSFGDERARLLIVGLAPAAHGANRTGRMFTGDRSGDWLFRALHDTGFANQPRSVGVDDGLELTDCRISAVVHCAPPDNKPTIEERNACLPYLAREIELMRPRVIIALGNFGWNGALMAIQQIRGKSGLGPVRPKPKFGPDAQAQIDDPSLLLLGSYHPSQQNTFTGRLTREMLESVFRRARAVLST